MQSHEVLSQSGRENRLFHETLREFPALKYLLGKVTPESVGTDDRPDGVNRPIYYLTEGSGMFGLTNHDDAMRWKGIFNHVMGSARQVYWLADRLKSLTGAQVQAFAERGFYISAPEKINPTDLRNFMLVSHAGRRQADEYSWHDLRGSTHKSGDSGVNTYQLLFKSGAPQRYLDLMRVETHADALVDRVTRDHMPSIVDNILTYCDWTFGQTPNSIDERFAGLRKSQRAAPEVLDTLERCGKSFEKALREIIDPDIFEHMTHAGPYEWEAQIREAYGATSGLSIKTVFPDYYNDVTNSSESVATRNSRLFKKDLGKWLEGKSHAVPLTLLEVLRRQWEFRGSDDDIARILAELGWEKKNGRLVPKQKRTIPESTVRVTLKPPTVIESRQGPKTPNQKSSKRDSDGKLIR